MCDETKKDDPGRIGRLGTLGRIKAPSYRVYDADLIVTTDGQVLKCRYADPTMFERVLVLDPETDFLDV